MRRRYLIRLWSIVIASLGGSGTNLMKLWQFTPRARKIFCVSHNNLDLLRLQLGEPLPNGEVVWNPFNVSTEAAPCGRTRAVGCGWLAYPGSSWDIKGRICCSRRWRDQNGGNVLLS